MSGNLFLLKSRKVMQMLGKMVGLGPSEENPIRTNSEQLQFPSEQNPNLNPNPIIP